MAYADTNFLVAYFFKREEKHIIAQKALEELKRKGKDIFISPITITELFCVISRDRQKYRLPRIYEDKLDEETRVKSLVNLVLKSLSAKVVDDEAKIEELDSAKLFHVFKKATDYSYRLKLKTLDTLHVVYASLLAEDGLIDMIVTFDNVFLKKKEQLSSLGLNVFVPSETNC